jgi:predicted nucleotide-binding protein
LDWNVRKEKSFKFVHFAPEVIQDAIVLALGSAALESDSLRSWTMSVSNTTEDWEHDSLEEFLAEYRRSNGEKMFIGYGEEKARLGVIVSAGYYEHNGVAQYGWSTKVQVTAKDRESIERVFALFERALPTAQRLPPPEKPKPVAQPTIFIGHGGSPLWRDLKDHLHDVHRYQVIAFETGARAGHTARDVLGEMLKKASFALLVLTAEDEQADGSMRARQNVIHEAGLFQGKLGFSRAILLLEQGCDEFSNVQGVQQIRFSKGNIRETFGDVLGALSREFPR